MQPIDHISIGVEYSDDPKRSSGARYHKVTTSEVYGLIGIVYILDNPKSAIFKVPKYYKNKNIRY